MCRMSFTADNELPDDIDQLKQLVLSQQHQLSSQLEAHNKEIEQRDKQLELRDKTIARRDELIADLEERLALLLSRRFGPSSEKLNDIQMSLFDESELEKAIVDLKNELQAEIENKEEREKKSKRKAAQPKRSPLPEKLRRVDIIVDVDDEEKARMGEDWEMIGYEDSEQLAVRDREYFVKRYRRCKYVRKQGEPEPAEHDIKVARPAPVILPKSLVDATVLAKIITGKFVDGLSFYREHKVLQREGIDIGYSTLCHYPIQLYERMELFREVLYEELAKAIRWHLDETTLQVLKEPDRAASTKSYMWCNRALFDGGGELVLFRYNPRRNYEALQQWLSPALEAFNGVVVSDEHKPYAKLAREYPQIVARGGCWSHARRKFSDAVKGRRHGSEAHLILKDIATLFRLDKKMNNLSGQALLDQRNKHIKPWCEKFKARLEKLSPIYPAKGLMKEAIGYCLNNWDSLTAFLEHADLVTTNDPVERSIRPFTTGRRNWIFSGGPRGAHASAFMYTPVESAKANNLEPKRYLTMLFEKLPQVTSREQLRSLLPHIFQFS